MEAVLKQLAEFTALAVEASAVILIAYGTLEALVLSVGHVVHARSPAGWRKTIFVRYGAWLLFGLQFALAANIVRSVIAPSWNDIGQLAAIAIMIIRTFLNYFLEKNLLKVSNAEVPKYSAKTTD